MPSRDGHEFDPCIAALDAIPGLRIDDRGMQAVGELSLMAQPSDVNWVRQDIVDMSPADRAAARLPSRPDNANGQMNILRIESDLQSHHAADFQIAPEELADEGNLV